jgi:FtsP/CotA-like multicopper oxidase with cupredoxin domain
MRATAQTGQPPATPYPDIGSQSPAGATLDAGLVDPVLVVKAGALVSIQVVNADPAAAHGLVITASGAGSSWLPMLTASPAFTGSAVWFLGNPTSAGMHAATLSFTASTPGTYRYLCPVPGHGQGGMTGTFIVTNT